jgi:hypothetical protein
MIHYPIVFAYVATVSFGLILIRSVLKLLMIKYPKRNLARKGYVFLTKIHPLLGIVAVVSVAIHCYLLPSFLKNTILYILLVGILLQGLLGILIKTSGILPPAIVRGSFKVHTKYLIFFFLLIFAFVGHAIAP